MRATTPQFGNLAQSNLAQSNESYWLPTATCCAVSLARLTNEFITQGELYYYAWRQQSGGGPYARRSSEPKLNYSTVL